jgi:hypothetical protein
VLNVGADDLMEPHAERSVWLYAQLGHAPHECGNIDWLEGVWRQSRHVEQILCAL